MKYTYLILFCLAACLTSCYDEPDWLGDNATTEGKHFPVIGTLEADQTEVNSGATVQLDMRFWSLDPIKETQLIAMVAGAADFDVIETIPYSFNFNDATQDEQLIMNYTAPTVTATTVYEVGARVINENGLERERTVTITVEP